MQEQEKEGAEPACALRPVEAQQDLAMRAPSMTRLTQPAIRHHKMICSARTILISLPILQHIYNPSQLSAIWKLNKCGSWFILQVINKNIESHRVQGRWLWNHNCCIFTGSTVLSSSPQLRVPQTARPPLGGCSETPPELKPF